VKAVTEALCGHSFRRVDQFTPALFRKALHGPFPLPHPRRTLRARSRRDWWASCFGRLNRRFTELSADYRPRSQTIAKELSRLRPRAARDEGWPSFVSGL